ncbi:DUF1064 domain-containing protein [Sulfurimonas sp. HSL-1656]|uniref:DUF1064 domain-containing protein n=1 Tax=Thiomicrolovo subterrani TaxID=3131934 RepID=UPI0031FA0F14
MSKYRAIKDTRIINGETVTFDSRAEARRFDELHTLAKAGKIKDLTLQPRYLLVDTLRVVGHRTMPKRHYVADFRYVDGNGRTIVEDVKGMVTPVYSLKKQLFLSIYGTEIIFKEIK